MRALAEFAMKGRPQAALVAVLATGSVYLAWVGAAVVALVCLRRGATEGIWLLGWSLMPALALLLWRGNVEPMGILVGAAVAGLVLRGTLSWPLALLAATGCGFVVAALLATAGTNAVALAQAVEMLERLYQNFEEAGVSLEGRPRAPAHVAALFGLAVAVMAALSLLLARWWQALLYNPGGFREEFHRLRLPPWMTVLLIGAGVLLTLPGPQWQWWALMVSVPLVFAGFALVHGLVAARGLGTVWLVACYALWLLSGWARALLLLLAVADSWLDLRNRWKRPAA